MKMVAHIDMDAFFAAVEERDKPYLRGLPIVVGADPQGGKGRGVVATANYSARSYGIRSAQPIREAWKRSCEAKRRGNKPAIFITPSFNRYARASNRIFGFIAQEISKKLEKGVSLDTVLEQTSIDEAYLDVSCLGTYAEAASMLRSLQECIMKEEHLSLSVGLGANKLMAKIASEAKKPGGFTVIKEEDGAAFLQPLHVQALPGVGPKYAEFLRSKGFVTVGDLQKQPLHTLNRLLGKRGEELKNLSGGIDDRLISGSRARKSIGEQETLPEDVHQLGELLPRLYAMAGNVWRRLKEDGFKGCKTVALTVRFANFATKVRSRTFREALRDRHVFERFAVQLLLPFLDSRENGAAAAIRMIGLRAEKLEEC